MMQARGAMMRGSGDALAKAVTIATRYSAVRKQGFQDGTQGISYKSDERVIIDHQIQRHRLFKQIATA